MGNFEKLSVLVIGVIIVMILVVAIYTWTGDPADPEQASPEQASALSTPAMPGLSPEGVGGPGSWIRWEPETPAPDAPPPEEIRPLPEEDLAAQAEIPATPSVPPAGDSAPAEERRYTVKSGQTLSHISLEVYGTTRHWPRISERNGVEPHQLRAGMELIIPAIDRTSPAADNKPVAAAPTGGPAPGSSYTVRAGDTIQKIARSAFGSAERWPDIWFENIERVDNPAFLPTGMTLRIPN